MTADSICPLPQLLGSDTYSSPVVKILTIFQKTKWGFLEAIASVVV